MTPGPNHRSLILILTVGLALVGPLRADDLQVGPGQQFETIQAAVDAAAVAGDVIHVAPGIYGEQVLVDGKDLTILGAGPGVTIVAAPPVLAPLDDGGLDRYPVLAVRSAVVQVAGLTIDGDGRGNAHEPFYGVLWRNAGGSLDDVTVLGVRNDPLDAEPHGVAVALVNDDLIPRGLDLTDCIVQDFQRAGVVALAATGTALDLTLTGCEIIGAGPTDLVVQQGLQVTGEDVTVAIDASDVRDLAWLGIDATAVGMLLEDCTGSVTGNTVSGCQTGLHLRAAAVTVAGNEITVPRPTDFGRGVVVDNLVAGFARTLAAVGPQPQPYGPESRSPRAPKSTVAIVLTDNTIALDPALDDHSGTVGLFAENREGAGDLDVTVNDNLFVGLATAILADDVLPSDGSWLAADFGANSFYACGTGIEADLPFTAAGTDCWWGAVDGPGGDGTGSGSLVLGSVDFDPWRTDLLNLVCEPDTLVLSETTTTGGMVFAYTGGASGRIYGFSLDVIWDPDVAGGAAGDFQRPSDGAFAAAAFFTAQEIAAGHVRVDAALGEAVAGIYDGPLFMADFSFLPDAPDSAETVLAITVNAIRDNQNEDLAGLEPDPGRIQVDSTPIIASVVITDTTIDSDAWTRDGHDIVVVATVIESRLELLTCDLGAFGGPLLSLEDAAIDGDEYTWEFTGIVGTGDGPVAATVTATDIHAAAAALDGAITADNTPPAPLAGLVVSPGHEKINLSWNEPAPDSGSPLQGVAFRHVTWGNYPTYEGPLPAPPATIEDGQPIDLALVGGSVHEWPVTPRDVYLLAGFVVDLVGNVSPLGDSGAATNYWLGDVDGDGYVAVVPEVTALGNTYGLSLGDPGYDPVSDVGPTMNASPRGIPDPQLDGYRIDFEDMMIFALNFGVVDPSLKSAPGGPPILQWDQLDPLTWVLRLAEPSPGLKGLNLRAELPGGVSCQVTPGALLAVQDAPVFLRNIAARGLDAGLATIGATATITGSGELARVTLSAPLASLPVTISARDLNNQELLVDLAEPSGQQVPTVHRLGQNFPNPFNPATTISFDLPQAERVHLAIYAVDGRLVATLLDAARAAGRHDVVWSGRDAADRPVAAGTYFYSLRAGDFRQVRKMTLAK